MQVDEARKRVEWASDILSKHLPEGRLKGARVLDIGCGSGNGLIAALAMGAKSAVGIDRDGEEFGEIHFPAVAAEFGVDPGLATLIAGDVFTLKFFDPGFDVVLMYDAIEHVPNPEAFIQFCVQALTPGGVCLIATCPLYYGAVGHHLWDHFPEATVPWAHLYRDFDERMAAAGVAEWGLQRYRELNKVTHAQVMQYIRDAGGRVIADHSISHPRFPAMLEDFRHLIDMTKVPSEADLLMDYLAISFGP
jgi:2-polyprenyl-3-methyl-5-hydroxy-6-metoxy-1,4-benzoquinol methylase